MYALNGCGIAFGSFLAGRMASYFRSKKMVNINLFVTLIIIGLMVLNGITIGSHLLSMIGIFLIIGSFGFTTALATDLAMQVPGINAGVSSAMVGLFGNIAGGISSPLVGLFGTSSPTPMFAIMLIFQVISIAAFYLLNTKKAVA
jgi:DHA1 family bicyclomycin/chloramphenicol resistance-like MFS transporter